jgi:hypothetical protein
MRKLQAGRLPEGNAPALLMIQRLHRGMQSATPGFSTAHMMPCFAYSMKAGNVTETHEHAVDFKQP